MDTNALAEYVAGRIRSGIAKAIIQEELLAVGWSEEESLDAYRAGLVLSGVPVPTEGNRAILPRKASSVDTVINFFSFILLGIVATALGTLFFQIINVIFPDVLDVIDWYTESQTASSIHYSIAALLIGFPLYFFALRLWFRKFREDEGRTESDFSKVLTYLVLLITAVTIVGDLITVVFTFLQGEMSVRFFLKALTILVIAGIIFGFYYLERRKIQYHEDIPRSIFRYFGRGVSVLVIFGVILGFFAGGSPSTQRNRTLDQTRAENLSALATCVEQYAGNLGALPSSLADLRQSSQHNYCGTFMQDPETGQMYEYQVVTPSRMDGTARIGEFKLCATFMLASYEKSAKNGTAGFVGGTVWHEHTAGYNCDTVTTQLLVPGSSSQTPLTNVFDKQK